MERIDMTVARTETQSNPTHNSTDCRSSEPPATVRNAVLPGGPESRFLVARMKTTVCQAERSFVLGYN
jgi:hypothetical protein